MLKIDRRAWHYKLLRWLWGYDKWGVWYLIGHAVILRGLRMDMLESIGRPFREPKGLCGYLWMLLIGVPLATMLGVGLPLFAFVVVCLWTPFRALGGLLLLPIRLLAAKTTLPDKAASTWQIVGEGAKAAHAHTCPRIEYVGGEKKEGGAA